MLKLTWRQAAAWRIRRQHLDQRAPAGSMLAVASRLCGLHAQVMSSAELTLWARVEDLDHGAVQRALWEERTLVKTWAMRGTLHLLPAAELPAWHALFSTSRRYLRAAPWKKYFGITLEELDLISAAIGKALEGRLMTREELVREVARVTGSAAFGTKLAENSWGTLLKPAAFAGRLCFAPGIGQRVRFTHPHTWLSAKGSPPVDPQTATAALTRRFLTAYGPATYHDLSRWFGRSVSTARQWIRSLGDEVCAIDLSGTEAWMLSAHTREAVEFVPVRSVRLLPGFDQYVVAASCHAGSLLPGDLRPRIFRPQGWISPVLLVNGYMQGVWRHEIKGSRLEVLIEPFVSLPVWVRRAAAQDAERLAAFFDCKLDLTWQI
jgi:uncharacterized protein YcaQ